MTPTYRLQYAQNTSLTKAAQFARTGNTQDLKTLLDEGLDSNSVDEKRQSPLMLASYHGHYETSKLLLERGAKVDLRNNRGQTPLGGVAFKGHFKLVELLVQHGADINADNGYGLTPLALAKMFGQNEVASFLKDNGGKETLGTRVASIPGHVVNMLKRAS